jgi:hypothetical protein
MNCMNYPGISLGLSLTSLGYKVKITFEGPATSCNIVTLTKCQLRPRRLIAE